MTHTADAELADAQARGEADKERLNSATLAAKRRGRAWAERQRLRDRYMIDDYNKAIQQSKGNIGVADRHMVMRYSQARNQGVELTVSAWRHFRDTHYKRVWVERDPIATGWWAALCALFGSSK